MSRKAIPTHLITVILKTYMDSIIRVNAGNGISEDSRVISQGVRQGCPLSPVLFNLHLDEVIRIWLQKLKLSKYFKEFSFNTLPFSDDQLIIADTEDNFQRAVYLLNSISKECNLEIATEKTKVFDFVGTDHLITIIIINDKTLEQVSQFTNLGCSISYQPSNDVEFKLAKFLQLIGTIRRTNFRKVRKETILKLYNTLVVPTFLYGSENWPLTASQRRRIEAVEMMLLRPLAGHTLNVLKPSGFFTYHKV
jgi:hypothetical protein